MRISDWSSDVCSSDRRVQPGSIARAHRGEPTAEGDSAGARAFSGSSSGGLFALAGARAVASRLPAPPGGTGGVARGVSGVQVRRSEEHTSELQSLMRISHAVFCLKKHNYGLSD